jgi:hypothetical protein
MENIYTIAADSLERAALEVVLASDARFGTNKSRERGLFGLQDANDLANSWRATSFKLRLRGIHHERVRLLAQD